MKRHAGYTLMELMVTVSIAAILLAVAVPSYRNFVSTSQRAEAATELFSALQRARSESITRNRTVMLCRRDYYSTTGPLCDSATDGLWEEGWIVFVSVDGDFDSGSGAEPDTGSEILAVHDPVGADLTITPPSTAPYIAFDSGGRATQSGGFVLCLDGITEGRRLDLLLSGLIALREISTCPG